MILPQTYRNPTSNTHQSLKKRHRRFTISCHTSLLTYSFAFVYISSLLSTHSLVESFKSSATLFHNYIRDSSDQRKDLVSLTRPILQSSYLSSERSITTVHNDMSSYEFPNWRVQRKGISSHHFLDSSSQKFFTSPFTHIHPTFVTPRNAPWSEEVYQSSLQLYDSLISCNDTFIQTSIQDALHTLCYAYRLYGPESVVGSFNGGKDAVVILELLRAAHANYYRERLLLQSGNEEKQNQHSARNTNTTMPTTIIRPRVIYFHDPHEFSQVFDFVSNTVHNYDLDMLAFDEGISFKDGLEILVPMNYPIPIPQQMSTISFSCLDEMISSIPPYPMAFVLGTRVCDPNAGSQGKFSPSSRYMPPFMRVNPILEWNYGQVWHFLRRFQLPYCCLYDEGYTSLGNVLDTVPCPALKKVSTGESSDNISNLTQSSVYNHNIHGNYWPAYLLKDWNQERSGRIQPSKKDQQEATSRAPTLSTQSTLDLSTENQSTDREGIHREVDKRHVLCINKGSDDGITSNIHEQHASPSEDDKSISSWNATNSQRSVGLIIVGDEILKGLTPDTNMHLAATALRSQNVPLSQVIVTADKQEDIVAAIRMLEEVTDVIITSGGVGPTHDDVTIKSVSVALESKLVLNKVMSDLLSEKMGTGEKTLTEAQKKMAMLPSCARLRHLGEKKSDWPILQCKNIFILPGVPQYFKSKIELLSRYLSSELPNFRCTYKVVLSIDETKIVSILNRVVENHPNVSFGSYPFVNHPEIKTVVTLEGKSSASNENFDSSMLPSGFDSEFKRIDLSVKLAISDLVSRLPDKSVLRVENNDFLSLPSERLSEVDLTIQK